MPRACASSRGQRGGAAAKTTKTLEFLRDCHDPEVVKVILKHASPGLLKSLCNIALNAVRGEDISFTPQQKKLFRKHKAAIVALANRDISLASKKRILQRGGGFFIPALIGGVLSLLGSSIVSKIAGSASS